MAGAEQVTEWQVLPTGLDPNSDNASSFAVVVKWRGVFNGKSGGGWSIAHCGSELSRGGDWTFHVPRFRRWQHRWETLEEAQQVARDVVDAVTVNGRTWAEWQVFHARRAAGEP